MYARLLVHSGGHSRVFVLNRVFELANSHLFPDLSHHRFLHHLRSLLFGLDGGILVVHLVCRYPCDTIIQS